MATSNTGSAGPPDDPTPDRADSPSVAHSIREHATALASALRVVRLTAGDDPRLAEVLDIADRQAKALGSLADKLHDPD